MIFAYLFKLAFICVYLLMYLAYVFSLSLAYVVVISRFAYPHLPLLVPLKKSLLRRRRHVEISASKAPNQGLESSFCRWTA